MDTTPTYWTIDAVAKRLGCSASMVRKLDAELRPLRASHGVRLYDPRHVAHVARLRAARAGERDATRARRVRFPRPRVSRATTAPKESDR